MSKSKYHKYVFDQENRIFKGDFENMYKAEKINNFDSWNQDDVSLLDKQICLKIVKELSFNTLLDVGCGKGALTNLFKRKDNSVFGSDLSHEAVSIANERYKNIHFFTADVNRSDWINTLNENLSLGLNKEKLDCIVCLETLSYIENWRRLIKDFSKQGKFALIKLFLPNDPIGYIKSKDELSDEFKSYFEIHQHIEFVKGNKVILFGKSKLAEEK